MALNSWGADFADRGLFKIAYGIGGVGNPADTYGLVCLPAPDDTAEQQRLSELRLPVKRRTDGCFDYTVDAFLTPDASFIASQLNISLVQLVRNNTPAVFSVVNVTYIHVRRQAQHRDGGGGGAGVRHARRPLPPAALSVHCRLEIVVVGVAEKGVAVVVAKWRQKGRQ